MGPPARATEPAGAHRELDPGEPQVVLLAEELALGGRCGRCVGEEPVDQCLDAGLVGVELGRHVIDHRHGVSLGSSSAAT